MKQGEKNKLYSFEDKMPDGRLTASSSVKEQYDMCAAISERKRLGRELSKKEFETFLRK